VSGLLQRELTDLVLGLSDPGAELIRRKERLWARAGDMAEEEDGVAVSFMAVAFLVLLVDSALALLLEAIPWVLVLLAVATVLWVSTQRKLTDFLLLLAEDLLCSSGAEFFR